MADEICAVAALSAYKPSCMSATVGRGTQAQLFTMTGTVLVQGVVSVGFAAAEALPLGEVTAPHWCWLKNLDATNFVRVQNGVGGAVVIKLLAGEFALFPWDDAAVPYVQADSAAVLIEYLVLSL